MEQLTLLVIGSGGREHALAWGLARSPRVGRIYVAPGNPGTEWPAMPGRAEALNVPISATDIPALVAFAREQAIDLTVVGPEQPLEQGIVDAFGDLPIFGPSRLAAKLESSKAFAKAFMREHNIPTANYACFDQYQPACDYLISQDRSRVGGWKGVVKADGLAAGKGVFMCNDLEAGLSALRQLMQDALLGTAGASVVIEDLLSGPEVSLLAISDGRNVFPLPPARDHKRLLEGDRGPNTGGMGAYAPAPDVDSELVERITRTIIEPAIAGMAARGTPYVGVLYAGVMLTPYGPKALEFNCRFGDPEAQVLIPLVPDLLELLLAAVEGRLDQVERTFLPGACATVVLAAPGYPAAPIAGIPIHGLEAACEHALIFQAGTARTHGQLVTAGGRVVAVGGRGATLSAALNQAYAGVHGVQFDGMHYRSDIGTSIPTMLIAAHDWTIEATANGTTTTNDLAAGSRRVR